MCILQTNQDDYRETELGLLPPCWKVLKIKDFAVTKSGGTPSTFTLGYWDGDIPWINSGELKNCRINYPTKFISELGLENSAAKLLPPSSIVIALTGTTTGMVGFLAFESSTNQSVVGILPNDKFDAHFLFYQLIYSRDRVLSFSTGAAQPHINKGVVDSLLVALPPISEQQHISYVMRSVQESKEQSEAVVSALRELKKSMMMHLFKYGPVSLEDAQKIPLKETEIGEIPEEWDVVNLGDCCEFLQYGTSKKCDSDPVGLPVLRIPNVIGGEIETSDLKYSNFSDKEVDNLVLEKGDILFVRTNGRREYVGRCAVYDNRPTRALFASYLIRVRLKSRSLPLFVKYFAETEYGKNNLSGRASNAADGKFNINTQTIKAAILPKPPLKVQEQILVVLSSVNERLEKEENKKKALEELFKSLLRDLMSAKVRSNNLDLS